MEILLWSCSNDEKEFGKDHSRSEIFIEDDEPYMISTIISNGLLYNIKVSKNIWINVNYISIKNIYSLYIIIIIMPLTCKLWFEHFDYNDEEFLNDFKRVNHYYMSFS